MKQTDKLREWLLNPTNKLIYHNEDGIDLVSVTDVLDVIEIMDLSFPNADLKEVREALNKVEGALSAASATIPYSGKINSMARSTVESGEISLKQALTIIDNIINPMEEK